MGPDNIRIITPNDDIDTEREYPLFRADKEVYLVGRSRDLQKDFIQRLSVGNHTTTKHLLIYKSGDFANLHQKVKWEQQVLEYTDIVVFWFSENPSDSEALFTLGRVLGSPTSKPNPKIIVGVHPDSPHRELIKNQLIYVGGGTPGIIAETLPELVEALEYYL